MQPGSSAAAANRGQFTFNGDSNIGGGLTAITTRTPQQRAESTRPGRFTYGGESNIGGGQTAVGRRTAGGKAKGAIPSLQKRNPRTQQREGLRETGSYVDFREGGGEMSVKIPSTPVERVRAQRRTKAVTPVERIQHGRELVEAVNEQRFKEMLAPHVAAFANDEIDEAELARRKTNTRKDAESELDVRRNSLNECEALLGMVSDADEKVSSLSRQLEEAALARDQTTAELEQALNEVMTALEESSGSGKPGRPASADAPGDGFQY